jgi:hypothetical protein
VRKYNITAWPELGVNFWGITKCANTSMKLHLYKLLSRSTLTLEKDTDINKHLKFLTPTIANKNNLTRSVYKIC